MQFYSEDNTMLELFPTHQKPHARVWLLMKKGEHGACVSENTGEYESQNIDETENEGENAYVWRVRMPVLSGTTYELCAEACEIGFAYLCGGAQEAAQGIRVLIPAATSGAAAAGAPGADAEVRHMASIATASAADDAADLNASRDSVATQRAVAAENPYREQYHFTPPTGWMNDPNGLCYHGGQYHLYYQFYPHAQQWGNMHWGHATSTNLVHWLHRPVFLTPQQELLEDETLAGGAFSGSAVTDGDSLRFFLTRHIAPRACEAAMVETQTMLQSPDGFAYGEEVTVIAQREPSHSYHFRDPKVFVHAGGQFMVLGSCVDGVPGVVMYAARDWTHWDYRGAVHLVGKAACEQGCESVECPDLFPLDGVWVCLAAHMNRTDEQNRKNPVHYAIGTWNGGELQMEHEGLLDFGGSFYAVQTFEHAGRRIAIGWIADFYAEHRERPGGVCGSMTLPRELHLRSGKLRQTPVREVYSLLGAVLHESDCGSVSACANTINRAGDTSGAEAMREDCAVRQNSAQHKTHAVNGDGGILKSLKTGLSREENVPLCISVADNCYYAAITLPEAAPFQCVLARDGSETLRLTSDGREIALLSSRLPTRRFAATCDCVEKVEIFFDRRTAEVFVNGGEAAGVKTFYSEAVSGSFEFTAQGRAHVQVRAVSGQLYF